MESKPIVIVIGGPNGAGKSTAAATLLPPDFTFLNADEIAKTLPGYPSEAADLEAGRILIREMELMESRQESFAVETTLASRTLAPRVRRLQGLGYFFRLVYVWSPSPEFSTARVAARVRAGGHAIPPDTIRRRYRAGLRNLFELYIPLADSWSVHDNMELTGFRIIAHGGRDKATVVCEADTWRTVQAGANHGM